MHITHLFFLVAAIFGLSFAWQVKAIFPCEVDGEFPDRCKEAQVNRREAKAADGIQGLHPRAIDLSTSLDNDDSAQTPFDQGYSAGFDAGWNVKGMRKPKNILEHITILSSQDGKKPEEHPEDLIALGNGVYIMEDFMTRKTRMLIIALASVTGVFGFICLAGFGYWALLFVKKWRAARNGVDVEAQMAARKGFGSHQ